MAKKENITIGNVSEASVNIDFSVGKGADNLSIDVILIQTMLHYIGKLGDIIMHNAGLRADEFPEINGVCDKKTERAILKFQRKNVQKLLKVDGMIHPANYQGRRIKPGEKRVMAITLMHYYAYDMRLYKNDHHYIDGLIKISPLLRVWLT